jgi:hypothetical protein
MKKSFTKNNENNSDKKQEILHAPANVEKLEEQEKTKEREYLNVFED